MKAAPEKKEGAILSMIEGKSATVRPIKKS